VKEYVFWYANDATDPDWIQDASIDHLIEYCNLKPIPEQKQIFFSSSIVDKTKNNIFFITTKVLGSGLKELLDLEDEIKWCDDNGITVIYDNSWESLEFCLPKNNIQEIQDIIPKKFKIFCNFLNGDVKLNDPTITPFLKYAVDVKFFPMYLGFQMELMKHDTWNVINPSKNIKRKYLFSLLCGEIRKPHRALTLAGLMAEDLLANSFYTTFLRKHGDEFQSTNSLYPVDAWIDEEHLQDFKYYNYLKDNYYDKILVNKLFDFPYTDSNEVSLGVDADFRIPIQMHESYFNIVFESFENEALCFFTEKTFKPMLAEIPFIICGTLHQNQHLKSLGFEIFPEIFDYSFEDFENNVKDPVEKLIKSTTNKLHYSEEFVAEIKRVSELPLSVFHQPSVLAKIKHNKELITQLGSKENTRNKLNEILS
jgi:hypothetical protein